MTRRSIIILGLLSGLSALGFSPYENQLLSGEQTHVAVMAAVKDGKAEELRAALSALHENKPVKALKKKKISNISSFSKELQGRIWMRSRPSNLSRPSRS